MKTLRYFALSILLLSGCGGGPSEVADSLPDSDDTSTDPIPDDSKSTSAFYKYCTAATNPADIQHSVDKLKDVVTQAGESSISCDVAYERLSTPSVDIDFTNQGITSLRPFGGLKGIGILDLKDNSITDLTGLEDVSNLHRLDLSGNSIEDISTLAKITSLRWLTIDKNPVKELGGVASLPGLYYFSFHDTRITDASAFANSQITGLSMGGPTMLNSYGFIGQMKKLDFLVIMDTNLGSVSFLTDNNKTLKFLNVSNTLLTDISPILKLDNLEVLILGFNQISNVDGVLMLPRLTDLAAYDNNISTIDSDLIHPDSKLVELALWENPGIADMSFLSKLPLLKKLRIWGSGVKHIPDLSRHADLEIVSAGDNALTATSVANILKAKNIHTLELRNNNLMSFDLPEPRPALKRLNLRANRDISTLDFLKNAPNLEFLNAYYLPIKNFPAGLGQSLTELYIEIDNDKDSIARLFDLPKIKNLDLEVRGREGFSVSLTENKTNITQLALRGESLLNTAFLKFLPNLSSFYGYGLKLRELTDFVELPLKRLTINNNCLSSIKPLAEATTIWSTLKELNLENNQIMDLDLLPADKTAKLDVFNTERNGKKKEDCAEGVR